MADQSHQTLPPNVLITSDQHAREQLAREMAAMKDNPLNETVPGGRYQGADGSFHDAEGRPLAGSAKGAAAKSGAAAKTGAVDGNDAPDYESMTVEELADEAGDLEVEGTGAGGRVLKADYVKALQKRDRAG